MRSVGTTLQQPLSRRLMPLAYALAAVIALIMALTWGVLQVQLTLGGFLNSESVWSKAQKQAVIDLDNYALSGDPRQLASFKDNYGLLESDRWGRDAVMSGHFDQAQITRVFERGNIMPAAQPGMIFMLQHFHDAPHIRKAIAAWRSTDATIAELNVISEELRKAWSDGSVSDAGIVRQRARINALNEYIQPRSDLFSVEVVNGAVWLGRVLFWGVLGAILLAALLWLRMARRILDSIRGSEQRYRLLFDSAGDAIVMVDEDSGRILDANRTVAAWTGRSEHELVGDSFGVLFADGVLPRDGTHGVAALRSADGQPRPVDMRSSLATWGELSVRQAIIRDISERVAMEKERRVAAEALASIAEGVIIADGDRKVVSVNAAHTEITGFTAHALHDHRFDETRTLPDGTPLPQSIWDSVATGRNWLGEVLSRRSDGSTYPEQLSVSAIRDADNRLLHYVAVFTDILAVKTNQRRLEHLATHDPLTGLVNRAEFERHCTEAIARAGQERTAVAVLFIDLDAFKIVNDSYSHAIGDRLLVKVAERIARQLDDGDVAGRIGGDEFTVLLGRLALREDATAVANRLLSALSEPFVVDEYEIVSSASIGIAGYPLDGGDALALIANADAAMYAAKTEERNALRFYTPMMHADARRRLALAAELRQALINDEFRLVYQPSVELRSGRIVAVEALLRWHHPERGEVMPDEFIPVAESLGLIRRIDEWVLQAATAQIQAWDEEGMPHIRVAVNVSARWFGHPAFVEGVSRALESRQLEPKRLLLEITESAMLQLGEHTERTMQALHGLGVDVAVDDFGTGYSSMAYLKLPAVAYLKVDRSFVTGLPGKTNDAAIVEAMLAMSRSLGLCTIAEGIETETQHDFLLQAGCQEGQGYLYSYPLPPAAVARLLCPKPLRAAAKLTLVPPKRN